MRQAAMPEDFGLSQWRTLMANDTKDPFGDLEEPRLPSAEAPRPSLTSLNPGDVTGLPPSLPPPAAEEAAEAAEAQAALKAAEEAAEAAEAQAALKAAEEAAEAAEAQAALKAAEEAAEAAKAQAALKAAEEAAEAAEAQAALKAAEEAAKPRHKLRVGREPRMNDWVIDNRSVSRQHAILTYKDDEVLVEDLGSSTGTAILDPSSGWSMVPKNHPVGVKVGTQIRFGGVLTTSSRDESGKVHFHYVEDNNALSPSQIFMWRGEELRALERLQASHVDASPALTREEQDRLIADQEAAEMNSPQPIQEAEFTEEAPKAPTTPDGDKPKPQAASQPVKSSQDSSGWLPILAILLVVGVILLILFYRGGRRTETLATPAPTHVREASTPTRDAHPASAGVDPIVEAPTPEATPEAIPVPEPTPVPMDPNPGYTCRPGNTVATCNNVRDFMLSRREGSAFWDCSLVSLKEYREIYRVEDPTASPRVLVADTCGCQYCEPAL